jgi:hypothetical protein
LLGTTSTVADEHLSGAAGEHVRAVDRLCRGAVGATLGVDTTMAIPG